MTAIFGILALTGCCGIPLAAVNLMIRRVQEKPVRKTLTVLILMILFLLLGVTGVNIL